MMLAPGQASDYLPNSIIELIEVIGHAAAEIIVQERGGITLCVPGDYSATHWLHNAIGPDAFTKLVAHYRGEEIWIPRCYKALHKLKKQQIAAEKSAGIATTTLARKYGCTDRYIRMIVAITQQEEPSPQTDLFE